MFAKNALEGKRTREKEIPAKEQYAACHLPRRKDSPLKRATPGKGGRR